MFTKRHSGGAVTRRSGVMVTFSEKRLQAITPAAELSELDLDRAVGGFNPQPDPPKVLIGQTRVNPSDVSLRARPIAG
jgi:hypothetical protein